MCLCSRSAAPGLPFHTSSAGPNPPGMLGDEALRGNGVSFQRGIKNCSRLRGKTLPNPFGMLGDEVLRGKTVPFMLTQCGGGNYFFISSEGNLNSFITFPSLSLIQLLNAFSPSVSSITLAPLPPGIPWYTVLPPL